MVAQHTDELVPAGRLARLRDLFDDVTAIMADLPTAEERDAFFQLVAMKVHAAYLSNAEFVYADRSALAHDQGKLPAADHYLARSRHFTTLKRAMLRHYNTVMSGGKWDGILTPEAFPPPTTALHPAGKPALRIGAARLGVVVWGDDGPVEHPRIVLSEHGTSPKWLKVFPTGAGGVDYTIAADDWIRVSDASGHVAVEQRIHVWADPAAGATARTGELVVRSGVDEVRVTVVLEAPVDAAAETWVEADGTCRSAPTCPTCATTVRPPGGRRSPTSAAAGTTSSRSRATEPTRGPTRSWATPAWAIACTCARRART